MFHGYGGDPTPSSLDVMDEVHLPSKQWSTKLLNKIFSCELLNRHPLRMFLASQYGEKLS